MGQIIGARMLGCKGKVRCPLFFTQESTKIASRGESEVLKNKMKSGALKPRLGVGWTETDLEPEPQPIRLRPPVDIGIDVRPPWGGEKEQERCLEICARRVAEAEAEFTACMRRATSDLERALCEVERDDSLRIAWEEFWECMWHAGA
jgi:hypothetical protein